MTKRRIILLSGGAIIALLVAGLVGVTVASAQEPPPEPPAPFSEHGALRGQRGPGGGFFDVARAGRRVMFDAVAEAMGLTPVELFTELHADKTVAEVAEQQGVGPEELAEVVNAARAENRKHAIEQAVEDGKLSQEQADWLLEGFEKGFLPRERGFGRRPGRDRALEGA